MNEGTKQLVKNLLSSAGQKCNYMTHNLAELGNGDMAEGLVALYRSGQLNGIVIGAGSITALVAAYHVGKAIIDGINAKKTIRQTAKEQAVEERSAVLQADSIPNTPAPGDHSIVETDSSALLPSDNQYDSDLSSIT